MTGAVRPEESWIGADLRDLEARGRLRRLALFPAGGADGAPGMLNLATNDYLGLARHPEVIRAAALAMERFGAGAGASRLLAGTLPCHAELEDALARLKGAESALVFGSGYAANVGIVSALVSKGDFVAADRLAHASLLDGARLAGATLRRFRHNDPGHLAALLRDAASARRRLVLTESVFSMDGDLAPLTEIAGAAARGRAMLLVDEAHATGLFGPGGAGRVRELGLEREVSLCMGTLSKALGGFGGFVACSAPLREVLVNRARSFLYSTALPPSAAGAALGALARLEADPGMGRRALEKAERFRARLRAAGLSTMRSAGPIVPVPAGPGEDAVRAAAALRESGILVGAIRPPTVPPGTERLRLSVSLAHEEAALESAADRVAAVLRPGAPA